MFGATSNNFFHPRLISPDLFWCVGVSASQEKIPSPITKCTGIKAASIRLTCFWSGFLSLNVSSAINLESFAFWHITGFLTEGVPQSYSMTLFHLLPLPFPGGSRGSPPGNFSLSSCVNLQNLKTDIHTTFVPFPFCIPPWGCPPILLYHSFTYCHYYSLGGPGGLPLVNSLFLLLQFTQP